jgi:hypothetical protein
MMIVKGKEIDMPNLSEDILNLSDQFNDGAITDVEFINKLIVYLSQMPDYPEDTRFAEVNKIAQALADMNNLG